MRKHWCPGCKVRFTSSTYSISEDLIPAGGITSYVICPECGEKYPIKSKAPKPALKRKPSPFRPKP